VTYASSSASLIGRNNVAAITKTLPVFRTRKRSVRSTSLESPAYEVLKAVETRMESAEREAFEAMFVASRTKFISMAHAILRNREDAEDAVQNAFLSGYIHLRSFEGRSALRTWFTRIVLNAALMIQRKRRLSPIQPLPENSNSGESNWTDSIPASEPDPEMVHAKQETRERINGVIWKMKPALRQAFTMTYYDELSAREACAALGVSAGTFKARLFRAKRQVLAQTQRSLVAPIRRTTLSEPESLNANDSRLGGDLNP
jgi:RNA polymerase sigma-70 factor (ECF subfamily)